MSSRSMNLRTMAALSATVMLLGVTLVAASQADAANVYACVKKNGSARISTKKPKCKKGETRLSWNTLSGKSGLNGRDGANGKSGSPGTDGTAGVNGAVAGYAAAQSGEVDMTAEKAVVVVSKTLPAGHYLVSAKVETSAVAKGAGLVETECALSDEGNPLDGSLWLASLSALAGKFFGESALPLLAVLNTNAPSMLSLTCRTLLNTASEDKITASKGQLLAIQTSSNS